MYQVLDKRSFDTRTYDFDCSLLLDPTETISAVTSVACDQGGLVFGVPVISSVPITYPDGHVAQAGKVVQVQISGGKIPAGAAFLMCAVRVGMVTSVNPQLEATVELRLVDNPEL